MSLWDGFVNTVKGLVSDVAGLGGTVSQTAISTGAGLETPSVALASGTQAPNTVAGLQNAAQQAIAKTTPTGTTAPQASADIALKVSKPVAEVTSKVINRPVATLGLLTDPNSPLYSATGGMGEGFQPADIVRAYNRTAKVSPFQALTKSSIFQDTPAGYLADSLLKQGKVDLKNVNLWNDQDIKKNFVDNTIGKLFTGTGDFVLSNLANAGVTGLAGKAASLAGKAANLTTVINTQADLANLDSLADSHITNLKSNGTMGQKTVFGADVQQLAETQDMNLIVNKVRDYSNNDALPSLIQKTNNPSIVKDLLLADKGYQPSLKRLLDNSPADLWQLGDVNSYIKGNVAASGILPTYEGEALTKVNAAYDQAISEVPSHQQVYEAFHDGSGSQIVQGNSYKPVDPPVFGGVIGAARTRAAEIGSALGTRSFDDLGGISETILGSGLNRPLTALIRFVGTEKPRGYITYQGTRPWDAVSELNAVFDDIRLFKNGDTPITTGFDLIDGKSIPKTVTAAEYRTDVINRFMNETTATGKYQMIEQLDKDLGRHIFYSYGFKSDEQIGSFTQQTRDILNGIHTSLAKDGYGFDGTGQRLMVNAQTQRQLADSSPMVPWGKVERDIRAHAKGKVVGTTTELLPAAAHNLFEGLNKAFSVSVLGRPSYIPKNSVAEPLITSFLSMGTKYFEDSVGTSISNAMKNNKNRLLGLVNKTKSLGEFKDINKTVAAKMDNLSEALHIRDNAQAAYEDAFNTDNLSPAAKAEHLETIKANLREAERLVGRIEADINVASKQYALSDKIPSVYNIRRRIEFLKAQPEGAVRYGSEIRSAELALQKASGNIATLSPEIAERNATIEQAWKLLDKAVNEKGLAEKEQAEIVGRIEDNKKRYYGSSEPHVFNIGGKQVTTERLFDPNQFGDALKNEFSNEDTIEQTFLNETRIGSKQSILSHKSPTAVVDVNSPIYYEELAYVVNRQMRGDPLVDMVLQNKPAEDIMAWGNTAEGKRYLRQFGYETSGDLKSVIQSRIDFVNRYIPDAAAREYAFREPVTSIGLQKLLAEKQDVLMPIHPTDVDYGSSATLGKASLFGNQVLKTMNAAYGGLMRAENPFRWVWADKQFANTVEQKLNLLHEQGVELTSEQVNAVRQASARETLQEAEKVFYTVRRQNRALYAARTVAAFPTASTSAMYRFGRLALKYPGRTAGFMRNYYGMYQTFGIDKDGNPVSDPSQAAYIVLPGTKEMGIGGEQGIRLSTKAVGFLVNMPGPSWIATTAVDKILSARPDNEQLVRRVYNDTLGHIPGMDYDSMFPVSSAGAGSAFVPSWLSDFKKYLAGNDSNIDFLNTHKMIFNYQMTMWEMGLGKKPTLQSTLAQTQDWFGQRAAWRFASPFGAAPQQTKPGQMFQDLSSGLLKKYGGDFNKAQSEMLQILGPSFPADRYLFRGSTKAAYVSPTLQGYERVWQKNPGLTADLAKLDPKTVALLTADLNGDPANQQVQQFMMNKDLRLPGGDLLNKDVMSVDQYENALQVNRTWNLYRTTKAELLTKMQAAGYKHIADDPNAQAAWNNYVVQLGQYNKSWYQDYNKNAAGDNAYTYAQAFKTITSNKAFMAQNKDNDFFNQMAAFVAQRDKAVQIYDQAPKGMKGQVQQAWVTFVQETTANAWNPALQQIIDRYFVNDKLKGTL